MLIGDLSRGIDTATATSIVFLGIGPSAIAFVTWAYAQRHVTVAKPSDPE